MTDDLVNVPVPVELVPRVYMLLGELLSETGKQGATDAAVPLDRELVTRMYDESYDGHKALMRLLASRPGEWLYTGEIASALAVDKGSRGVAGMLGAFGRRSKHRYAGHKPWVSEWDSRREESRHRMAPEIAAWIGEAAAGS